MIRSAMDDLYDVESLLRWINEYWLFNECLECLFENILYDILHKPLGWFFPDLEISRRNIFGPSPEIGQKDFWSLQGKLLLMYFPDTIEQIWHYTLLYDVSMLHNCTLCYAFVAYTFAHHQVINQRKNLSWPMNAISLGRKFFKFLTD